MISLMMFLVIVAGIIAMTVRSQATSHYFRRMTLWIGILWTLIFGVMTFDGFVESVWPRLPRFTGAPWQPIGPMVLGIVVLCLYFYQKRRAES